VAQYIGLVVLMLIVLCVIFFFRRRSGRATESPTVPEIPNGPPEKEPVPHYQREFVRSGGSKSALAQDGTLLIGGHSVAQFPDLARVFVLDQESAIAALTDGSIEAWLRSGRGRALADLIAWINHLHPTDGARALAEAALGLFPPQFRDRFPICGECRRFLPTSQKSWTWSCPTCGRANGEAGSPMLVKCPGCSDWPETVPCPFCSHPAHPRQFWDEHESPQWEAKGLVSLRDLFMSGRVRFAAILLERPHDALTQEHVDYVAELFTGAAFRCSQPAGAAFLASGQVRFLPETTFLSGELYAETWPQLNQMSGFPPPIRSISLRIGGTGMDLISNVL
jgi:hypothetical protein